MTELIIKKRLLRLHTILVDFPDYAVVYNKADGRRGQVIGWKINADGSIRICVHYGIDGQVYEFPGSLSLKKVVIDEDEDWKEEADS